MLATAIEAEVDDYLAGRASTVDAAGRRYVVRNGHLPPRAIQTPLGDVQVQRPRVRDRRPTDERETFRSAILPPCRHEQDENAEGKCDWVRHTQEYILGLERKLEAARRARRL